MRTFINSQLGERLDFIDEHLDSVFTNLEVLEEYKFTVD